MSRRLFTKIVREVTDASQFFQERYDCTGQRSISALMKCTSAVRQLAYGCVPDSLDEYLQMGATTARDSLRIFCKGKAICPDYFSEEQHRADDPVRTHAKSMQFTQEIIDRTAHLNLERLQPLHNDRQLAKSSMQALLSFLIGRFQHDVEKQLRPPHCEAKKAQKNQNSEAGQTSMARDGSVFMYDPDYLREQFATFEECVFDDEVQQNEAIPLSEEEIALELAAKRTNISLRAGPRYDYMLTAKPKKIY
ncbi:hypothetical protein Tco_0388853 [Tanacetum coccineum]